MISWYALAIGLISSPAVQGVLATVRDAADQVSSAATAAHLKDLKAFFEAHCDSIANQVAQNHAATTDASRISTGQVERLLSDRAAAVQSALRSETATASGAFTNPLLGAPEFAYLI